MTTAFTGPHLHFTIEAGSTTYADPTSDNGCVHTANGTRDPRTYLRSVTPGNGSLVDGTFVVRPNGDVYRIAGGAPIYVSS